MKSPHFTSFGGMKRVGTGSLAEMLIQTKEYLDRYEEPVLIFDDRTGRQTDFDFRGSLEDVLDRAIPPTPKAGPGRPRLGVVSAEITLLPRHWEWLNSQPSSVSASLRRLVDAAMKQGVGEQKRVIEAAAAFMWAIAGNLENFEESSRALYALDWPLFQSLTAAWPEDVRSHLEFLLEELDSSQAGSILKA